MSTVDVLLLTVGAALAVAAVAGGAVLSLGARAHGPPPPALEHLDAEEADRPLAAIVVNPTKVGDAVLLRAAMERACEQAGWAPPLWLETTLDDPGEGQARAALAAGADVVAALGGDGTLRRVAEVLAGTGTAMGLVPAGTGNLLARNLDVSTSRASEIPPDDAEAAMRVVLTGDDRRIDVGWVTVVGAPGTSPDGAHPLPGDGPDEGRGAPDEGPEAAAEAAAGAPAGGATVVGGGVHRREQAFLVMAGMGFDATIMAAVPDSLKARVGPLAYFVSGLRHVNGTRVRLTLTVDGTTHHRRVRTVVVGNVGRLQGGLALMPDAEVDDGYLDVIAVGPRSLLGWLDVVGRVLTRHRRGDARLAHWRGRGIELVAEQPQPAQVDGDPIGDVLALRMRVDEGALIVRVAAGARAGASGQLATPARRWASHARARVKSSSAVPAGGTGESPSARG